MPRVLKPTNRASSFAKILRTKSTHAESLLWKKLRGRRFIGQKFRRQVPVGPYIIDFLSYSRKLIIELDGDAHLMKKSHDKIRENYLINAGFSVLRFNNDQVIHAVDFVLEKIASEMAPHPDPLPAGEGGKARL